MNGDSEHTLEPVPNMLDIGDLARIPRKCFFLRFGVTV
jgi:hypothetical protein